MNELSPSLSYVEGNARIYPNSLLFRAGEYPDKQMSVTAEDIAAAVASFSPVHLNLEHAKHGALSILNGKVGTIRRAWIDADDPAIARGEVAIPLWVDDELANRGISMEVSHADKRFSGGALTYTPRVDGAALMSAYALFTGVDDLAAKSNTASFMGWADTIHPWGTAGGTTTMNPMQQHHDLAVSHGAECGGSTLFSQARERAGDVASFMTPETLKAIQKIHDHASDNGASCDAYKTRMAMYSKDSGQSRSTAGAAPAHDPPDKGKKGPISMSLWDKFKAALEGAADDDKETPSRAGTTEQAGAAGFSSADFAALKAEVTAVKAERDALTARFAEQETAKKTEGKALNLALFAEDKTKQAGADAIFDALSGDALTLHLENVKAEHARRFPANARQTVPTPVSNFARDVEGGVKQTADEEAKINELLALTPNGRQALKNGKGGK